MSAFREKLTAATSEGPDRKLAGAVVIAANQLGQIHYLDARGSTSVDPDNAKAITPTTTMWIASCTKLLTTIAALQCVEKGLLSLDEDICTVLPEWKERKLLVSFKEESGEPIFEQPKNKTTLRQLLTHSNGMSYDFISPKLMQWRGWRGEDINKVAFEGIIRKQYNGPLVFEPGQGWTYGSGIDWAGQMVEAVNNNARLGDYFRAHIWEPLGMNSTAFRPGDNPLVQANLCSMTERSSDGSLRPTPAIRTMTAKDDLGGGGLYSCADDYVKVLIALLRNDGTLLKPETVDEMFKPQLPDAKYLLAEVNRPGFGRIYKSGVDSDAWTFGFGGILNEDDVEGVCYKGTLSWGGLPNLFWWIDRKAGTCGAYFSQLLPPGDDFSMDMAVDFRREIFKDLAAKL